MIELLLLEPDFWRYTGIQHIAEKTGHVRLIGEPHFEKILGAKRTPMRAFPDITMLAHRLIQDHGLALIPHLRDLFAGTSVLVYGDDDRLERVAELLAVGARGYFLMSAAAAPSYLLKALQVLYDGRVWAPREAVVLLANGPRRQLPSRGAGSAAFDEQSLLDLLCAGLSNKEIAQRFGLAEVTIKARMSRLYRKYGVKTRVQLLATAMKGNLARTVM